MCFGATSFCAPTCGSPGRMAMPRWPICGGENQCVRPFCAACADGLDSAGGGEQG